MLSTATSAPGLRGTAQTGSRSATLSSGFEGDSNQIRSTPPQARTQPDVSSTATRCTDQRPLSVPAARPATEPVRCCTIANKSLPLFAALQQFSQHSWLAFTRTADNRALSRPISITS